MVQSGAIFSNVQKFFTADAKTLIESVPGSSSPPLLPRVLLDQTQNDTSR